MYSTVIDTLDRHSAYVPMTSRRMVGYATGYNPSDNWMRHRVLESEAVYDSCLDTVRAHLQDYVVPGSGDRLPEGVLCETNGAYYCLDGNTIDSDNAYLVSWAIHLSRRVAA